MARPSRPRKVTFTDFLRLSEGKQKADLIDGVIYKDPPESPRSNELSMWLFFHLANFVEERRLGRLFLYYVAFRLGRYDGPEPDFAFVRAERCHRLRRQYVNGPPDLAVEVVAPESVERDYVLKRDLYRRAGVPEYWIVDAREKRFTLLQLDSCGRYREARACEGELHSQVLPGFWVRPAWLWQYPLPLLRPTYQEITARLR